MNKFVVTILLLSLCILNSCRTSGQGTPGKGTDKATVSLTHSGAKTIHVMVALCDNRYQGIVPVPAKIGNGQDPGHNLYWGCAYGVRSFFRKSKNWQLVSLYKRNDTLLERAVFRHRNTGYYLVADAVNGKYIKHSTELLLRSCAGTYSDTAHAEGKVLGIGAHATLLAYIGHDGLMDFSLDQDFEQADAKKRDLIILACYSKRFFAAPVAQTGANPLLWSTGLMSPEAYTLHDALECYLQGKPATILRSEAAKAYARYQKCSQKAALNLLVSGY